MAVTPSISQVRGINLRLKKLTPASIKAARSTTPLRRGRRCRVKRVRARRTHKKATPLYVCAITNKHAPTGGWITKSLKWFRFQPAAAAACNLLCREKSCAAQPIALRRAKQGVIIQRERRGVISLALWRNGTCAELEVTEALATFRQSSAVDRWVMVLLRESETFFLANFASGDFSRSPSLNWHHTLRTCTDLVINLLSVGVAN